MAPFWFNIFCNSLWEEVKTVVINSFAFLNTVELLAISFPWISKLGPFKYWGGLGWTTLGANSTSNEIASAVCNDIQILSFNPYWVGKASYNFTITLNWSGLVSSSKAILIPVIRLLLLKLRKNHWNILMGVFLF